MQRLQDQLAKEQNQTECTTRKCKLFGSNLDAHWRARAVSTITDFDEESTEGKLIHAHHQMFLLAKISIFIVTIAWFVSTGKIKEQLFQVFKEA